MPIFGVAVRETKQPAVVMAARRKFIIPHGPARIPAWEFIVINAVGRDINKD